MQYAKIFRLRLAACYIYDVNCRGKHNNKIANVVEFYAQTVVGDRF